MKKKCIRFISLAIFLALAGPAWGSHAAGECGDTTHNGGDVPCSCGDTVTTDTVLDSGTDLVVSTVCTCNGLDVADGVELDLGGNTITGSETCVGVLIEAGADIVTIKNGTIEKFATGIGTDPAATCTTPATCTTGSMITRIKARRNTDTGISVVGSNNILDLNRLQFNGQSGIVVDGDENKLIRNQVICTKKFGCESDGIKVSGDKNTLDRNLSDRNGGDGVSVSGDKNTLNRNLSNRNDDDGIFVDGTGNTLKRNMANFNEGNGVLATGGTILFPNIDGGRNRGKRNGGVQCEIDGTPCKP